MKIGGRVYISSLSSSFSPRAKLFSVLHFFSILASFTSSGTILVLFLFADFQLFLLPCIEFALILRHPVYIAGGDRIIVRRISVWFLRGANKTSLRASRVSYRPSCALHTRVPIRLKARAWLCVCACTYMSTGKHSTISQSRLVGIGYRVHSKAVASFLAHYWPPVLISLDSRPSGNWFMSLCLLYAQIYNIFYSSKQSIVVLAVYIFSYQSYIIHQIVQIKSR